MASQWLAPGARFLHTGRFSFFAVAGFLAILIVWSFRHDMWTNQFGLKIYDSPLEAVLESTANAGCTVVFASGNKAMNNFMRNWGESLLRVRNPPSFFFLPLDEAGYKDLQSDRKWVLVRDTDAWSLFGPSRSGFGGDGYNKMSAYKWDKVLDMLGHGFHVLMSDPDVTFMRNPLPYLETLPECDIYPMIDLGSGMNAANMRSAGGYTLGTYMNYYNGGFAFFRATPQMQTALRYFKQYIVEQRAAGVDKEEQTYFNSMLTVEYEFIMPPNLDRNRKEDTGQAVIDAIMESRCLEYVKKDNPTQRLKVYPLNPALFPNHPLHSRQQFHMAIVEKPFIVHYNWIVTSREKKDAMVKDGHWYIDESASVPD